MELLYEDWKYIKKFEGIYIISNRGRIVSMYRIIIVKTKDGIRRRPQKGQEIITKQLPTKYAVTCLHKNGGDFSISVHRLVAVHFVQNSDKKPWVNHKDGVRWNNAWYNLEWTTISENHLHAYKELNRVNPAAKPIIMYDLNHNEVRRFANCSEAGRVLNRHPSTIADHVAGKIKMSGRKPLKYGYYFKLAI
jgi:hypothetical protein